MTSGSSLESDGTCKGQTCPASRSIQKHRMLKDAQGMSLTFLTCTTHSATAASPDVASHGQHCIANLERCSHTPQRLTRPGSIAQCQYQNIGTSTAASRCLQYQSVHAHPCTTSPSRSVSRSLILIDHEAGQVFSLLIIYS